MPERHLWSCDEQGNAFFLSTWQAGWRRLRVRLGHQLRVTRLSASPWCLWAIAADQSPYLFVPSNGTTIRVSENIIQNERWKPTTGFSAANLLPSDPPEIERDGAPLDKHQKVSWTSLTSTRWRWESDEWEYVLQHSEDKSGWEYSTSFASDAVFTSFYHSAAVVRRRRCQRYRRFLGHDRWLLCCISSRDLKPASGLASGGRSIWPSSDGSVVHVRQLCVGGADIPHQLPGFLTVWAVTKDGAVLYRTNVHRLNPEGSAWRPAPLMSALREKQTKSQQGRLCTDYCSTGPQPYVLDIGVNAGGDVWVLTDECEIFVRVGVSWSQPFGESWQPLVCGPPALFEHEHLTTLCLGHRMAWVLSNRGRCWLRTGINVSCNSSCQNVSSLSNPNNCQRSWSRMVGTFKDLVISSCDQVLAIDRTTNRLLFRAGITPKTPGGEAWIALELPILPGLGDAEHDADEDDSGDDDGPFTHSRPSLFKAIHDVVRYHSNHKDVVSGEENVNLIRRESANSVNKVLAAANASGATISDKFRLMLKTTTISKKNALGMPPQLSHFFGSFRNLLKDHHYHNNGDRSVNELEAFAEEPRVGFPPKLNHLSAEALSCLEQGENLPVLWLIANLVTNKQYPSEHFLANELTSDANNEPKWMLSIKESLRRQEVSTYLVDNRYERAFFDPSWSCSFAVDVLPAHSSASMDSTSRGAKYSPRNWSHGNLTVQGVESTVENITLSFAPACVPGRQNVFLSEDTKTTAWNQKAEEMPHLVNQSEILWAGKIDPVSILIPWTMKMPNKTRHKLLSTSSSSPQRTQKERKHSANAIITQESFSRAGSSVDLYLSSTSSSHDAGHFVAVFVKNQSKQVPISFSQPMLTGSEADCTMMLEKPSLVDSDYVLQGASEKISQGHRWVFRFQSSDEASALLKHLPQLAPSSLPKNCDIVWMVSDLGEVFNAKTLPNKCMEKLTWCKVGGHLARVVGLSTKNNAIIWGLGHNGTPWVHRSDWIHGERPTFSAAKFPFHPPYIQTDIKQFCIYEFQVWRVLHGFSSGSNIERNVMWSRDEYREHPCDLFDTQLPPFPFCHWLGSWEIDYTQTPTRQCISSSKFRFVGSTNDLMNIDQPSSGTIGDRQQSPSTPHADSTIEISESGESFSSSDALVMTDVPLDSTLLRKNNRESLKESRAYPGSEASVLYPSTQCDEAGWQYASNLNSLFGHRMKWNSGARRRRWVRSCFVSTDGPWQEIGSPKLRNLALAVHTGLRQGDKSSLPAVDLWAVTWEGELVFRVGVTASNPAGSSWRHYPIKWNLTWIAISPSGRQLWTICQQFGLLWTANVSPRVPYQQEEQDLPRRLGTWRSMGLSPHGCGWSIVSASTSSVWAVDAGGQLWVSKDQKPLAWWTLVASPRVIDISCSPDGQVYAVFADTHSLATRTGISANCLYGTGWSLSLRGIVYTVSYSSMSTNPL